MRRTAVELKQISIVARNLKYFTASSEAEAPNDHFAIPARCSTQEVEYDEKYAYSLKMWSGCTYSLSCTRKHCSQTSAWSGK